MQAKRAPSRRPCVLVLWVGRRPGPLTCRSLERAGYRVLAAHPEGEHGGRSGVALRPLRYPSPTDRPDEFLAFVAAVCRRRQVDAVLPLDEDIVKLLAERPPDLGGRSRRGARSAPVSRPLRQGRARAHRGRGGREPAGVGRRRSASSPEGWPPLPSLVASQAGACYPGR